jgi:Tol biopolymer transport system component
MIRIRVAVPLLVAAAYLAGGGAWAGTTECVSVSSTGELANGSSWNSAISADGRYVAFDSWSSNLVPDDTNAKPDVFVRDRLLGTTERVSVSSSEAQADGNSAFAAISADGRYVAFVSEATNLVPDDTNAQPGQPWTGTDVFVRDRLDGTTERASLTSAGQQSMTYGIENVAISPDGTSVAFSTGAEDLVPGDTNIVQDVFLRDLEAGTTERVSISDGEAQGNYLSSGMSLSADGRYVAFASYAGNLVAGDTNGWWDVFVRDRQLGTTVRVSVGTGSPGAQGNQTSGAPSISADGRYVAFASSASNLVSGDTNGLGDVFVRDTQLNTTERVSVTGAEAQATGGHSGVPAISSTGQFVGFYSDATNLVTGDTNAKRDIFLRDRTAGTTERVSVTAAGAQANNDSNQPVGVSSDGMVVCFYSAASNLVAGDTNGQVDIFVRDRAPTPPTISIAGGSSCVGAPDVTLQVTCGDCTEVRFRNDPGDWGDWEACAATKPWMLPAGDGLKRVCIQGRNATPWTSPEVCDEVTLDSAFPTSLSISIHGGASCTNNRDETLTLAATGATKMSFRNEGGEWSAWEPFTTTKDWRLSAGEGMKTVGFLCRDDCNNESAEATDDILLDTTAPAGLSVTINSGAACADSANVTLTLAASDAAEMRFRNESGTWSAWEPFATTKSWVLSSARGTKTVGFQARDACYNAAAEVTDQIVRPTFDDVLCANSQRPYVEALVREGIAGGCGANPPLYCPTANVNRAQMAKFLCIAAGKQTLDKATPTFADVPKAHWAYGYVERLADAASWPGGAPTGGCRVEGTSKYFCPNNAVTREQMAKFLCVAASKSPMASCAGTFGDVTSANSFCRYIERLTDAPSWPGGVAVTSGCGASATGPPRRAWARPPYRRAFGIAL